MAGEASCEAMEREGAEPRKAWFLRSKNDAKHHTPHLHAIYGDYEAVLDFEGNLLEGELPAGKLKLTVAWITIHKDELKANWKLLSDGDGFYKIPPLV